MPAKVKLYLGRKIIDSLPKATNHCPTQLQPYIEIGTSAKPQNIELNLPCNVLAMNLGISDMKDILKIKPDDIIKNVACKTEKSTPKISFEIDRNIFVKDVLENCMKPEFCFEPRKIVVEFSSVNIAKPFHLGHLRSTIIGNFVSNLNSFVGNKVTKLNYLGDWGTQFGFIKVGVDMLNYTPEEIKNNPLKLLYESYVYANKLAESNPEILDRAKREFNELELNPETDYWRDFLNYTRVELDSTYKRLGVTFDEYHYESMYNARKIKPLIDELARKNIITKQKNGKQTALVNNQPVSVVKSDGSTLYLTRDIAAAIDRFQRFQFDHMYYVVDNAQSDHFVALQTILQQMGLKWADKVQHIKYGRVRGMSSRKGSAVFLKDILDECRDLMFRKQAESRTTKVQISKNSDVSDILSVSCVIINDLKQKRQRDYEFTWDRVLQSEGDTGIKLQYTHCRLFNLEQNCGHLPANQVIPEILEEPEVLILIKELGRFNEVLVRANQHFEACILVNYLFHLCNHISKALKVIKVKGSNPDIASQRLLVFQTSRKVLNTGMTILGLQPLNEM